MQKSKEIEIQGQMFLLTEYSVDKGLLLFPRVLNIIGPAISQLKGVGLDSEIGLEVIGNMITAFSKSCEPQEFLEVVKQLVQGTKINGEKGWRDIVFNHDFAGKYLLLFSLLKEIVVFQYSDFLAGVTGFTAQNPVVKAPVIQAI